MKKESLPNQNWWRIKYWCKRSDCERSIQEQGALSRTLSHQVTPSAILTKIRILATFRSDPSPLLEKRSISAPTPSPCLWQLTFPNVKNPPPQKKNGRFWHRWPSLMSRTTPPPPPQKKNGRFGHRWPSRMSRTTPASTKAQKSRFFLGEGVKASPAKGWRRCSWHSGRSTVPKSTVFFVGGGGFLTFGKGQRSQNRPFFFLGGEEGINEKSATKNRPNMALIGQAEARGQRWPKSAWPDQNRPKLAKLKAVAKSPWPK